MAKPRVSVTMVLSLEEYDLLEQYASGAPISRIAKKIVLDKIQEGEVE
jgi:hypothetical protein